MPSPTVWPFTLGAGVTLLAFGIPTSLLFSAAGFLVTVYGLIGWIRELVHE